MELLYKSLPPTLPLHPGSGDGTQGVSFRWGLLKSWRSSGPGLANWRLQVSQVMLDMSAIAGSLLLVSGGAGNFCDVGFANML